MSGKTIRRCEADYSFYHLNNIEFCMYEGCKLVRNNTGAIVDNVCVNQKACCNQFGSPRDLADSILKFRQLLWSRTKHSSSFSPFRRQDKLVNYLEQCKHIFNYTLYLMVTLC